MNKILVIEDDRIMRENMAEILELSGYLVDVAKDGKDGVKHAKSTKPDLIVCDIKMPVLDGYGVLHILSKDPETAGIPFIFVTAKTERDNRRKGMEMGADDYLTKPFEDTELLKAVETRLKKHELVLKQTIDNAAEVDDFTNADHSMLSFKDGNKPTISEEYQQGDSVFKAGEHPHFLFFVETGRIKTYRINPDGKELIMNIYSAGDYFGYQAILENRVYNTSAEALEKCLVLKTSKADFIASISKNKKLAAELIKTISENLSEKEQDLIYMAYDSVRKRLANKLIELIPPESAGSIVISRIDLAALVGTSPETLVRTLTELRELRIIESDSHKITLVDRVKLNKLFRAW